MLRRTFRERNLISRRERKQYGRRSKQSKAKAASLYEAGMHLGRAWLTGYLHCTHFLVGPRLVRRGIGAVRVTVATVATVAFRLYLVIIVQTLTN